MKIYEAISNKDTDYRIICIKENLHEDEAIVRQSMK